MGRIIKGPESFNIPLANFEVDLDQLNQVLEEIRPEDIPKILDEGFLWRVTYLYIDKLHLKMESEELAEFYKKNGGLRQEIIKIIKSKYGSHEIDDAEERREGKFREHQELRKDLY